MKLKEIVNYGTQALTGNKIEDSSIKAKLLLQYILKQNSIKEWTYPKILDTFL